MFPPTEIEKAVVENDAISEGWIFSSNLSKTSLKFNFSIEFLSKSQDFVKISQQFIFSVQKRERVTQGF